MREDVVIADISCTEEWAALKAHASEMRTAHLRGLFASDPGRAEQFTATVGDLTVDWSRPACHEPHRGTAAGTG